MQECLLTQLDRANNWTPSCQLHTSENIAIGPTREKHPGARGGCNVTSRVPRVQGRQQENGVLTLQTGDLRLGGYRTGTYTTCQPLLHNR